ncbi:hypothetical protein TrCOL_g10739 [Triparma columacea]|nr:hypothetical protein TrCOL_g10739 [Triparma columacea]
MHSSQTPPTSRVTSGSPLMLKKLRVLQSSCLASLSRLREIQSSSTSGVPGSLAPTVDPGQVLEKVVRDQAYRIAALEEKLERQGEVYGNVLPAQAEYVKELEAAVAGMEREVSDLTAANERDKESFQDMVKVLEREKIRAERLEGKCGMLSGFASEVHERVRVGRERMVGMMATYRDRDLSRRCFEAIRGETRGGKEERVKMRRFLAKWKKQGVSKCFMAWERHVAEEKRYKVLVLRFMGRINNSIAFKALARWVEVVELRKHNRSVIGRFRSRMLNVTLGKSLRTWVEFRDSRRYARKVARRAFGRLVHGVKAEAFHIWAGCLGDEEIERRKVRAFKVLGRAINKQVGKGWDTWKAWVRERRREEGVLKRFSARMLRREVMKGFGGWREFVETRKRVRRIVRRMIGGMDEAWVKEAWGVWRGNVRERSWEETKGLLEEKTRRVEELEAKLEMLETAGKDRAMAAAKRMVQQWQSGVVVRVFGAWRDWSRGELEGRVKMERFVKRWKNLAVNGCWVSWVSYVSENKRYRSVVGRFVSRMKMRFVAMCFDGFARFALEAKRERVVLDKFRRRWGNMTVARGFGG